MQIPSPQALTHSPHAASHGVSLHDQMQMALAIADPNILKSLLLNSTPMLVSAEKLGRVTAAIGVPVEARKTVDGVISYETVHCVLAESPEAIEADIAARTDPKLLRRELMKLTRCESDTHTLGKGLRLAEAIALLEQAGFDADTVAQILNVPEAWHKSWWYTRDADGQLTVPFLRLIRSLHYPDGTFAIQYKDYYEQDQPVCFTRQEHRVLVEIKTESHSFRKTLERITTARELLGVEQAILIGDRLSPLEAQAFISQGISVYTAEELVLYTRSDCTLCANEDCPLNHREDSPVMMCRRFCLDGTC